MFYLKKDIFLKKKSNFSPQRCHVGLRLDRGLEWNSRLQMQVVNHGSAVWRLVDDIWVLLPLIPSSSRSDMTWVRVELLHDTGTGHVRSTTFADKNEFPDHITWPSCSGKLAFSPDRVEEAADLRGRESSPPAMFWVIYANGRRQQPHGWKPPLTCRVSISMLSLEFRPALKPIKKKTFLDIRPHFDYN